MLCILLPEQKEKMHQAVLRLLQTTGVVIKEKGILDILTSAGACLKGKERVLISPSMVENAIQKAPARVVIYDREAKEKLILEDRKVYFGVHGDCPTILDPVTSQKREYIVSDADKIACLCDYLPNIDFVSQNGFAKDIKEPRIIAPIIFKHMLENTTKPLGFSCYDIDTFEMVMEIAEIAAGGREKLRKRPFFYHYSEPTSPLVHSAPSLRRLKMAVERGIPLVYTPMPMAGATAPATLAGTLVQGLAETLSGVVIAQLISPGAPCIMGGITTIMDMRSTICSYGAPEMLITIAALTEMAQYYKLPMFGTAGCTDAKKVDGQAAIESALSCMSALLSGANLVHDVGLIDHAETVSPEMVVLTDEIIDMVRKYNNGIEINDETLALGLIDKIQPGGNYISEEHTVKHFRDFWFPGLFDRSMSDENAPKQTFEERLREKTIEIMQTHKPKLLPDDITKELERIEKGLLSGKYV